MTVALYLLAFSVCCMWAGITFSVIKMIIDSYKAEEYALMLFQTGIFVMMVFIAMVGIIGLNQE